MKKSVVFLLMLLGCCISASAQRYQEVVYLKNGSVIRGVVTEQIPGVSLKVQTSDGSVFAYPMSDVEKITKEQAVRKSENPFTKNFSDSYRPTGYRGFVDFGGAVEVGDYGDGVISLSTSHGYQFNPYFFLGAGVGLDYHFGWETVFIPIFADARVNFMDRKITPFFDLKIGYSVADGQGFYMNPSVGVNFGFSPRFGLNASIGYNLQRTELFFYSPWWSASEDITVGGISIKVGVEF